MDKVTGKSLIADTDVTRLANTSGANTGDETASGIRTKLGITTISGSNTGDQDLTSFATTTSPLFTGIPTAPTATTETNTDQIATTAYVNAVLSKASVVDGFAGAIWTSATTGTLNGIGFTLSNLESRTATPWDLTTSAFAQKLSISQPMIGYAVSDDWKVVFLSEIANLKIYCKYWRPGNYVFDQPFTIVSGTGLTKSSNTLTVVSGFGNGIIEFAGPITELNVDSDQDNINNRSSQLLTFASIIPGTNNTQLATTKFVSNEIEGKFVDLTTDQTIAGVKTFSSDAKINGITVGRGAGNIETNTANGNGALKSNITGEENTANGTSALESNTTGIVNTATGSNSLHANSTGSENTANGFKSLFSNTTGNGNTANGYGALFLNTTGGDNTANGNGALYSNTTGSNNIASGIGALQSNTTGSNNTAIGNSADVDTGDLTNATAIGNTAIVTASNTIQLGNTAVTNVKTSGTITAGAVTYPKIDGTANQVLSTNGSGTIGWVTSASSGVPYTGATGVVNLGGYDLTVNGLTIGKGRETISSNTAVGVSVLDSNTTGDSNTAVGNQSLFYNTRGSRNTANGYRSLYNNTRGNFNTADGFEALLTNTTGSSNTANGSDALANNTNGNDNTASGRGSLYLNSSGSYNTAIGRLALYENTIGANNTAVGMEALKRNISGNENTAVGPYALRENRFGNGNTGLGSNSLRSNQSGDNNTAVGNQSLYSNTTGSGNTANGIGALYYNTTGSNNIASGIGALQLNTTGSNNTAIGNSAGVDTGDLTNATAIGNTAIVTASNTIQLGNTAVTNVKTSGTITAGSVTYLNIDGTSGQVLTTNGNGATTWQTPAGVVAHNIGESYGGGIVFYVYDNGQHGLIAATTDQSTAKWYNGTFKYTGTTGDGLGAGAMNTAMIVATQMSDNQTGIFAAKICADYSVSVGTVLYGDWYLPSKYELQLLYLQRNVVGGFADDVYWSSSEDDVTYAWSQYFGNGSLYGYSKVTTGYVRAVRAF